MGQAWEPGFGLGGGGVLQRKVTGCWVKKTLENLVSPGQVLHLLPPYEGWKILTLQGKENAKVCAEAGERSPSPHNRQE